MLRVDRGKNAEADGGCFFRVSIDRNCCHCLLRVGELERMVPM